jgi:hypothetical protein
MKNPFRTLTLQEQVVKDLQQVQDRIYWWRKQQVLADHKVTYYEDLLQALVDDYPDMVNQHPPTPTP